MKHNYCLWIILFLPALIGGCSNYRVSLQGVDLELLSQTFSPRSLPPSPPAAEHNNLGVILEQEGNFSGALAQYRLALQADPELTVAYVNAGNVCLKLNNFAGADFYYREALDLDPNNPRALNNRAWLYLQKEEEIPRAITLIRRAISADPDHSYLYLDSLGWALYRNGEIKEAIPTLQAALKQTPAEETYLLSETHYHLGRIYRKEGEEEKAVSHLRKSLELTDSPSRKSEIRSLLIPSPESQ